MNERYYRQCKLRRGNVRTVSWIPEKFAHKHRPVKLKKDNGEWQDGWIVTEVGAREVEHIVKDMEDAHRRQRGQSDI